MTEAYGRIEWWCGDTKSVGCWRSSCKACWVTVGCLLKEQKFSLSSKRELSKMAACSVAWWTVTRKEKCWLAAGWGRCVVESASGMILWVLGFGALTSVSSGICCEYFLAINAAVPATCAVLRGVWWRHPVVYIWRVTQQPEEPWVVVLFHIYRMWGKIKGQYTVL